MTSRKRNETNVEFITRVMEFANTGPLAQMFLIDAIGKWSKHIVDDRENVIKEMENGFVNGEAWVAAAEEWKCELDEKYGKK
jgi:hypothetical protein|tara:strand:+ start:466 stop:711 length:246 start_codon:yes stop_codon:yes gene_type:complete